MMRESSVCKIVKGKSGDKKTRKKTREDLPGLFLQSRDEVVTYEAFFATACSTGL